MDSDLDDWMILKFLNPQFQVNVQTQVYMSIDCTACLVKEILKIYINLIYTISHLDININ